MLESMKGSNEASRRRILAQAKKFEIDPTLIGVDEPLTPDQGTQPGALERAREILERRGQ